MDSIDALVDALATFEGGVIAVSHDKRFVSLLGRKQRSEGGVSVGRDMGMSGW